MCRIRAGGGCVRVGGTVWNTLKGASTEKKGGETNGDYITIQSKLSKYEQVERGAQILVILW